MNKETKSIRKTIGCTCILECVECGDEISIQEEYFNQGKCDACAFSIEKLRSKLYRSEKTYKGETK